MYELVDILVEIEVVKENLKYLIFFFYFDFLLGIIFIINKFFYNL